MIVRILAILSLASIVLAVDPADVLSQTPKTYTTSQGAEVRLPLGDLSFADEFIELRAGSPSPDSTFLDGHQVLGPPDYVTSTDTTYLTLGCGGSVVFEFTDNVLVDGPGPDLHVFEIGPDVEGTAVEVSDDGDTWLAVGEISGGKSWIDISEVDTEIERFSFVRLTDLEAACSSSWPGADLDAVAATNSIIKLSLQSNLLFAFDSYVLQDSASAVVDSVAAWINDLGTVDVLVEGHTDSVGTAEYNSQLSRNRSNAVMEALQGRTDADSVSYQTRGLGEAFPVESNATDEGRQQNRRVDIYISIRSLP